MEDYMSGVFDWKGAKCGNVDEIDKIVKQYYRLAFKIAHKWVGTKKIEHDEAISLSLLALMKCIHGNFNPERGEFTAYLGAAVDNEIRMFLRTESKHSRVCSYDAYVFLDNDGNEVTWLEVLESDLPGPDERLDEEESLQEAFEILILAAQQMSEKEWACFSLAVLQNLTYAEISAEVGISISYTSKLLRSARKKLAIEKHKFLENCGESVVC